MKKQWDDDAIILSNSDNDEPFSASNQKARNTSTRKSKAKATKPATGGKRGITFSDSDEEDLSFPVRKRKH